MGLADRLGPKRADGARDDSDPNASGSFIVNNGKRKADLLSEGARRLKIKVHNRLFETIDISKLESLDPSLVSTKVIAAITDILSEDGRLLTETDRDRLVQEIKNELLGLGPLEPLLRDEAVTDIMVNGAHQVYVEKGGKLHLTDVQFYDDQHVMLIIDRIVSRVGRRVDEASPQVDARLPDGSRINAIIPPLAIDGPSLSIRRFRAIPFVIQDLINRGSLNEDMAIFLGYAVQARLNILVAGGTSAGKT